MPATESAGLVDPASQTAVPTVGQVMAEERATSFTKRSVKAGARLTGLRLAVAMTDLPTLEGEDTPGKVAYLCRKANREVSGGHQGTDYFSLP